MDFLLTEEQTMIVDMVRRFVQDEILPLEMTLDPDADEVAPEVLAKLAKKTKAMGLYGLDTPPEYGGPDIDMVTRVLIAIECSQHRAGIYVPCYGAFGGRVRHSFLRQQRHKKKNIFIQCCGERNEYFLDYRNHPGEVTPHVLFKRGRSEMEMTIGF